MKKIKTRKTRLKETGIEQVLAIQKIATPISTDERVAETTAKIEQVLPDSESSPIVRTASSEEIKEKVEAVNEVSVEDLFRNGELAETKKNDMTEVINWYKKAAEKGHMEAQYKLGRIYLTEGENEKNTKKLEDAFKYFNKPAAQGSSQAKCYLGVMYRDGKGTKVDLLEAIKCFQDAKGEARAQNDLGCLLYGDGKDLKKLKEAFEYFNKAAHLGSAVAQYNLGILYRDGKGIKQDLKLARELFEKAAINRHVDAIKDLIKLHNERLQKNRSKIEKIQSNVKQNIAKARQKSEEAERKSEEAERKIKELLERLEKVNRELKQAEIVIAEVNKKMEQAEQENEAAKKDRDEIAKAKAHNEHLIKELKQKIAKMIQKNVKLEQERAELIQKNAKLEQEIIELNRTTLEQMLKDNSEDAPTSSGSSAKVLDKCPITTAHDASKHKSIKASSSVGAADLTKTRVQDSSGAVTAVRTKEVKKMKEVAEQDSRDSFSSEAAAVPMPNLDPGFQEQRFPTIFTKAVDTFSAAIGMRKW